jgi:NDP-sugar pyrophosphorylase family protein
VSEGAWLQNFAARESPVNAVPTTARCLESLDCFVLGGGLGTRIQPVLGDVPKLLAPISGRPYLDYLIDWLGRFGARRIVLGLGHRASSVVEYLRGVRPPHGIELAMVIEPRPLGTAGAIRFARKELHSDPVLIVNGDSYVDADLCEFLRVHHAVSAMGSIVCAEVDNAGRFGRVEVDGAGRIRGFIEKDAAFSGKAFINAGVYLLSAALLDDIATGEAVSLERDVFERLPPGSLAASTGRFTFIDIGTSESFARAGSVLNSIDWGPQRISRT